MMVNPIEEMLFTFFILAGLLYILYTRFKNQSLKDTAEEIKEVIVLPTS